MDLRFHWMLPKGGEVAVDGVQTPQEAARYRIDSMGSASPAPRPDRKGWLHFARRAEEAGIDSVLISFSRYEPDPLIVAAALGQGTSRLKFMVAYRSGLMQPTTFVQQINTLSALVQGRVSVNIVAGSSRAEQRGYGDFLEHDDRYDRASEFLAVCRAFWRGGEEVDFNGRYYQVERGRISTPFVSPYGREPELYISGHSEQSERLAYAQGTTWLRVIDTPEKLQPMVARVKAQGLRVCLRLCVICRPTHEEAVHVAETLLPDETITRRAGLLRLKDDSHMYAEGAALPADGYWLDRSLWAGFVPSYGPVWTTLLGTPRELADAFLAYKSIGVDEFIISGWPEIDEMTRLGREVIPLVRDAEHRQEQVAPPPLAMLLRA